MLKILILNNKTCRVVDATEEIIKKLKRLLSFRQIGVEYSIAFQNGWSGVTYLLNQKLISLNKVPRNYQLDIVNAAINNEKGIIRACTGSGKTQVAAMITAKINKHTNIYVIGLDLL